MREAKDLWGLGKIDIEEMMTSGVVTAKSILSPFVDVGLLVFMT